MKKIATIFLFTFSYVIADIEINNSSIDFGPVSIGETKLDTIQVVNNLGIAQVVTFVGIASPFSVTPNGQEIGANQSMEFILSFNPTELGDYNLEVEVDGNISAQSGSAFLTLQGEGTQVEISVNPTSLDFGSTAIGGSSTAQIAVYNNGTGVMLVDGITFDNDMWNTATSSLTINEGENESFTIIFTPDLAGAWSGTMSLASNDPNVPVLEVPLTGTGVSNVSGEISGTWSLVNSPYYITENITVPSGDTLKIDPGVQIKAYQSTRITVKGTMLAIGHPDSLITFSSNTNDQLWSGVTFDTSGNSSMIYCRIEDVAGDWFTKNNELIKEGMWTADNPEEFTIENNYFTVAHWKCIYE